MKKERHIADPLTGILFLPPSYEPRLTRGEMRGLLAIAAILIAVAATFVLGQ